MCDYEKFPILLYLQKLEGATTVELKDIIVSLFKQYLLFDLDDIVGKKVCFGANVVVVFLGSKMRVTKKLQD